MCLWFLSISGHYLNTASAQSGLLFGQLCVLRLDAALTWLLGRRRLDGPLRLLLMLEKDGLLLLESQNFAEIGRQDASLENCSCLKSSHSRLLLQVTFRIEADFYRGLGLLLLLVLLVDYLLTLRGRGTTPIQMNQVLFFLSLSGVRLGLLGQKVHDRGPYPITLNKFLLLKILCDLLLGNLLRGGAILTCHTIVEGIGCLAVLGQVSRKSFL